MSIRRGLAIAALCLGLSGCMGFSFWFDRLEQLAMWRLETMFAPDAAQEQLLEEGVAFSESWLREEGLPNVRTLLEESLVLWERGDRLAAAAMLQEGAEGWINAMLLANYPAFEPALLSFSAANFAAWEAYAQERQEEWYEGSRSRQHRVDSRIERLQDWFGSLSDAQRALVAEGVSWEEGELAMRKDNMAGVRQRVRTLVEAGDRHALKTALTQPERLQSEAFRQWKLRQQRDLQRILEQLVPTLTDAQTEHAASRARDWIRHIDEVTAQPSA